MPIAEIKVEVPAGLVVNLDAGSSIPCKNAVTCSAGRVGQLVTVNVGTPLREPPFNIVLDVTNPSALGSVGSFRIEAYGPSSAENYAKIDPPVNIVKKCGDIAEKDCICVKDLLSSWNDDQKCSNSQWCNQKAGKCSWVDAPTFAISLPLIPVAVSFGDLVRRLANRSSRLVRRQKWGKLETFMTTSFAVQGLTSVAAMVTYGVRRFQQKKPLQKWLHYSFLGIQTAASFGVIIQTYVPQKFPFGLRKKRMTLGGGVGIGAILSALTNVVMIIVSTQWGLA